MSPTDPELQPVEPMLSLTKCMWESGTVIEALKLCREPSLPCSPPASPPSAEPAEPSTPSQEGSATAGGAACTCRRPQNFWWSWQDNDGELATDRIVRRAEKLVEDWIVCPWCVGKLGEGEG